MLTRVLTHEEAEMSLLSLMTADTHKFALIGCNSKISLGYVLDDQRQHALERLMLKDWVRLIDVEPISIYPDHMLRIFRVMPEAVAWYAAELAKHP